MSTCSAHALIIEDEIIIALELEDLLRQLGFTSFDIAASPAEALEQACRRRPSLITADVRISGGTGIEALSAITNALGEIPYFYVTGNTDMVRDAPPRRVVEKPIDARRFRSACAAALGEGPCN